MQLGIWTEQLPNNLEYFGFAVHCHNAKHVGVLLHLDDGVVRFCHFAWHHLLLNQDANAAASRKYIWGNSGLDIYNKRFLAGKFSYVSSVNPDSLPYGIDASGACLDENDVFLPLPLGKGLTCASFIVAVMRSLGYPLLNEESWPVGSEEDKKWAAQVIQDLTDNEAPQAHIDAVLKDIDTVARFRPSQVAGAMSAEESPVDFEEAERLSAEIVAHLATMTS